MRPRDDPDGVARRIRGEHAVVHAAPGVDHRGRARVHVQPHQAPVRRQDQAPAGRADTRRDTQRHPTRCRRRRGARAPEALVVPPVRAQRGIAAWSRREDRGCVPARPPVPCHPRPEVARLAPGSACEGSSDVHTKVTTTNASSPMTTTSVRRDLRASWRSFFERSALWPRGDAHGRTRTRLLRGAVLSVRGSSARDVYVDQSRPRRVESDAEATEASLHLS